MKLDDDLRRFIEGRQEPLQPARYPGAAVRRQALVEKVRAARQEIAQMFIDVEHWNTHVRKPAEAPIDPDPHGDFKELVAFYDRILKNDMQ